MLQSLANYEEFFDNNICHALFRAVKIEHSPRGLVGTGTNQDGRNEPNRVLIGTSSSNTKWDRIKSIKIASVDYIIYLVAFGCCYIETYLVIGPSRVGLAACLVMKLSGNLRSAGRESLLLISSWFYKVIDSVISYTGFITNTIQRNVVPGLTTSEGQLAFDGASHG